ncbi:hypothetical protein KCU75_g50, partial [Aureobasidium melanogenum]
MNDFDSPCLLCSAEASHHLIVRVSLAVNQKRQSTFWDVRSLLVLLHHGCKELNVAELCISSTHRGSGSWCTRVNGLSLAADPTRAVESAVSHLMYILGRRIKTEKRGSQPGARVRVCLYCDLRTQLLTAMTCGDTCGESTYFLRLNRRSRLRLLAVRYQIGNIARTDAANVLRSD